MLWICAVSLFLLSSRENNFAFADTFENDPSDTKIYAVYFPQFHRDKLNDELWGEGFTEWDNVRSAPLVNREKKTLVLPSELGYYDLMDINVRRKQRELAKEYGIDGFIYHHYWFHHEGEGATLAGAIEQILKDGEPDLPFALNWAKESWVTTWNARFDPNKKFDTTKAVGEKDVLREQIMPDAKSKLVEEHYNYLKQYFHHKNYIKVNGAPLFSVYGADHHEAPSIAIINRLKELAMADGFPSPGLHVPLMGSVANSALYNKPWLPFPYSPIQEGIGHEIFDSVWYYPFAFAFKPTTLMRLPIECRNPEAVAQRKSAPFAVGILSSFDNTPRRNVQDALIYARDDQGLPPGKTLEMDVVTSLIVNACCQSVESYKAAGNFMTINAWNEWGEGNVLEPSAKYGRSLLEAMKDGKKMARQIGCDWNKFDAYMNESYSHATFNR